MRRAFRPDRGVAARQLRFVEGGHRQRPPLKRLYSLSWLVRTIIRRAAPPQGATQCYHIPMLRHPQHEDLTLNLSKGEVHYVSVRREALAHQLVEPDDLVGAGAAAAAEHSACTQKTL